jgi:hypothetical protein
MRVLHLTLIILLIASCATSRKTGNASSNDFIAQYIKGIEAKGEITKSPLIIIDGIAFEYSDYLKSHKPIMQSGIREINYLRKNSQTAYDIFGERGKPGVIIVATTSLKVPKILYLLDDKEITSEEFDNVEQTDIETFEIIRSQEGIRKYTTKEYDSVWIIKLKKRWD